MQGKTLFIGKFVFFYNITMKETSELVCLNDNFCNGPPIDIIVLER